MNIGQLRSLCEIVDRNLKITDAAHALFRSQSSVTRHIQDLERELGIEIFRRNRNKVFEVTAHGKEVLKIARRIVNDARNLSRLSEDLAHLSEGEFCIATTHTQAYYTLPAVIREFQKRYPKVRLSLHQGTPDQCYEMVINRVADLALCTKKEDYAERIDYIDNLIEFPVYRVNRSILTPKDHPLLHLKKVTLEDIAKYPLIAFDKKFRSRSIVDNTFAERGIKTTTVLHAIDAGVIKRYVEMGMGIAVLSSIAYDKRKDVNLRCIDARGLFQASIVNFIFPRDGYLRRYIMEFIQMFAPHVTMPELENANEAIAFPANRELPEI